MGQRPGTEQNVDAGENETTNWTTGFGPWLNLFTRTCHFGVALCLIHRHVLISRLFLQRIRGREVFSQISC